MDARADAVIVALGPPGAWPYWWAGLKREAQAHGLDLCVPVLRCRQNRLRELPYRDIDELVDELYGDLSPTLTGYAAVHVIGICASSFAALGLARRLARRFPTQTHLVRPGTEQPQEDEQLNTMSEVVFVQVAQRAGMLPEHASKNPEFARLVVPALRNDLRVMWRPAAAPVGLPTTAVLTYGTEPPPDWVPRESLDVSYQKVVAGEADDQIVVSSVLPQIVAARQCG